MNTPCDYQLLNVGGEATSRRCSRKDSNSNQKHQSTTQQIAQRTTQQNQGSQKQSVGFDHPLHIHHRCMKGGLERRQSYIDDGAVDESQAGTENGRGEDPESRFHSTRNCRTRRPDDGFVGEEGANERGSIC